MPLLQESNRDEPDWSQPHTSLVELGDAFFEPARPSEGRIVHDLGTVALLEPEEEVILAKCIEAGMYAEKLREATMDSWHLMDEAYVQKIHWIIEDGKVAKNYMIEANLRLVGSIARKYLGTGLDYEDLMQEGMFGLVRAVEKFDYTKGVKFSTYASSWVRESITQSIDRTARFIYLPVDLEKETRRIARTRASLAHSLQRTPTDKEVADKLKLTPARLKELDSFPCTTVSSDVPISEASNTTFSEQMAAAVSERSHNLQLEALAALNSVLNDDQYELVTDWFGLKTGRAGMDRPAMAVRNGNNAIAIGRIVSDMLGIVQQSGVAAEIAKLVDESEVIRV